MTRAANWIRMLFERRSAPDAYSLDARPAKARSPEAGLATTEFALLMSFFLVPLLWGLLEASEAMTVNRRVTSAVNSLADLTAQSESFTETDLDALIADIGRIVNPADGVQHPLDIKVVSVVLDADDNPTVDWSRDDLQGSPYSSGSAYGKLGDPSLLIPGDSLIVAEMRYEYELSFFSNFFSSPVIFERHSVRYPRLVDQVVLCSGGGDCP